MSAEQHLAQFGVSVASARDFILANLARPQFIYSTAESFGITNEMLGEIYGGADKYQVVEFFRSVGIDSTPLEDVTGAPISEGLFQYSFAREDALFRSTSNLGNDVSSMPDNLYIDEVILEFQDSELEGRLSIADFTAGNSSSYALLFDFNSDKEADLSFNFNTLGASSIAFSLKVQATGIALSESIKQTAVVTSMDLINDQLTFSINTDLLSEYLQATGASNAAVEGLEDYSSFNLAGFSASSSSLEMINGQYMQTTETAYYLM